MVLDPSSIKFASLPHMPDPDWPVLQLGEECGVVRRDVRLLHAHELLELLLRRRLLLLQEVRARARARARARVRVRVREGGIDQSRTLIRVS